MGRRMSGGEVPFVVTFPKYASRATVAPPLNTASNFKPSTPNASYVYGQPLSVPAVVVGSSIGNKKPPWAAFAQGGFHKHVLVPSDVRLSRESNLPGSMGRPPLRAFGLRDECDSSILELSNLSTVKRPSSLRKPVGSGVRRFSLLRTIAAAPYADSIRPPRSRRVRSACSETSGRWVTRRTDVPCSRTRSRISDRMAWAC